METTPLATPGAKTTPRDVFMHLLAIVTLYASVISFITLLFQYINVWYPDPLTYYYQGVVSAIRWSASVLVVMYPVFMLMTWLINRDNATDQTKRDIKIRKWLTYLTLFVSAITIIIDVITLVYQFLGGELTIKFLLKILVVLIVAAGVFGYYFWDLKRGTGSNSKIKMLGWAVLVIMLGAIMGSYFVIGSPAQQRSRNFDQRRVENLQEIKVQVVNHWQQKGVLPKTLAELTDSISGFSAPKDPESGNDYEYIVLSNLSFQLCSNFNLESLEKGTNPSRTMYDPYGYDYNWAHGKGRVCFDQTIDPEKYKPQSPSAIPLK